VIIIYEDDLSNVQTRLGVIEVTTPTRFALAKIFHCPLDLRD
jgi:hypothetical protein